jgi:predicted phosphoribosyltransferase
MLPYSDRREAGRLLAAQLRAYAGRHDVLVLGLPRGGVPVAYEVARALDAPLDVFVVRKLGAPGHEELAMGAIASGGVRVLVPEVVAALGVSRRELDEAADDEYRELERRERLFRGGRAPPSYAGRTVILVDDGLATGATMRAAVEALRELGPRRIVVAVPAGAAETCAELTRLADEVICAATPEPFQAVGLWYRDFAQTSDDEVRMLLADAAGELARRGGAG